MKDDGFIKRLEELVAEFGMGHYSRFAQMVGTGATTVDNYIKGKSLPNMKLIVGICEQCGVTPNWLLLGWQPKFGANARPMPEEIRMVDLAGVGNLTSADFQTVPILKSDAWKDPGIVAISTETMEGFTVSRAKPNARLAAIRMPDEAMGDEVSAGDLIVFDVENREAERVETHLAVVKLDDLVTVRRVIDERFLSGDARRFPPQRALRRAIIGVVVEIRKNLCRGARV